MRRPPLRTVLVGLGMIGAQYGDDPKTKQHYPFATHADVLQSHPDFDWIGASDRCEDAVAAARYRWPELTIGTSLTELAELKPDVVVLATGPHGRTTILDHFSEVRGVICEKPVGRSIDDGSAFVESCRRRGIRLQVNLWRRADRLMRQLAGGQLNQLIGSIQNMCCRYGRGIRNNGLHCIDLFRMLAGEIQFVQAIGNTASTESAGLIADADVSFVVQTFDGTLGTFHAVDFDSYRDLAFDFWGHDGRLVIDQEGLRTSYYPRVAHRAISTAHEIEHDNGQQLTTSAGRAFFEVYQDLADSINHGCESVANGETAIQSERIVDAVIESARVGGARIGLEIWPTQRHRIAS